MAEQVAVCDEPYVALTPLYAVSSDSEDLSIGGVFRLVKYKQDSSLPLPADDILRKHLQLYEPDYLLWQRAAVEKDALRELMSPFSFRGEGAVDKLVATLSVLFYFPATNFFRLLRLFKPGRLVAGNTFVVSCETHGNEGVWETAFGQRCSETVIDYDLLVVQRGSYTLSSVEVPFFDAFSEALLPVLQSQQRSTGLRPLSPLEVALLLYNQDESQPSVAVLNIFTALEALLTSETNTELSYRLSLRVANLLGSDDVARLKTFKDMKEFYDLRSKIIHGGASKLSPKLQARLEETDSLREILRRTILSVMALSLERKSAIDQLDQLLDEIVFDQGKRREVQKLAAKFLHMNAAPPCTVH